MDSQDNNLILFQSQDGKVRLEVKKEGETVWLRQEQIAELFGKDVSGISRHIAQIFKDGELDKDSNLQKMQIPFSDKPVNFYSLDVILAVGYRANSRRAVEFRRWATSILKEYIYKGFVLDDERLKQLGGGGYWKELLDRIRDIRSSEKVMYRQVLDIYATGSQVLQDAGRVSHDEAMQKAETEYRKWQQSTLSPVEQAYLDTIKMLGKKSTGKK